MSCAACGHANPVGNRFCGGCGAALAVSCPACAHANPPDHRFCGGCGAALVPAKGAPPVTTPSAPERTPRAYTPKHLADKILASRAALEGERKQVTVLFADVRGSLELAEQVDAEQWHAILDRFFAILTDGVHRFEGTVNQYTGDGIMALFGAPLAHEDHAQRACYAALHLQGALRELAQELRRERGLDFATRIGINSGEVVVGKIGDDLRMDYTAQGHTVGLAQRMEALAEAGAVYVAPATAALVAGYFELEALGEFTLKGVREPVRVAALRGAGRLRTRLDVSRARGFSRFVGRADETAALEAALARAQLGQGSVVGVVGEAGTGKSRLCFELAERCRARGIAVREARCVSHGKNLALLPVLELLRAIFEIEERDAPQTARNKIAGAALLADRALEDALPLFFELLGVADAAQPTHALEPEERSRRLHAAVRTLVAARSRRGEVALLLLEDLHWIDDASEAFLASLVEACAQTRTLLVANFRPEYRAGWMAKSWVQQLPLLPLGPEAAAELLRDLLGNDASLAGLPERVLERSAGNPFFVEEIVQELAERGVLAGAKGAYRLTTALADLRIPANVQALLGARIDRLAEREKRVLQAASAIGLEFPRALLASAAPLPAAELAAALSALVDAELLREIAVYPDAEYAFKHPLTQEVASKSQLEGPRAAVHARLAAELARGVADAPSERAALIAHHFDAASDALAAARWHRRAAQFAGVFEPELMAHHWRRAAARVRELAPSRERDELAIEAAAGFFEAARRVARWDNEAEELAAAYELGRAGARALGDGAREAELTAASTVYRMVRTGELGDAIAELESARELAAASGADALNAYIHYGLAIALFRVCRSADAAAAAARSVALIEQAREVPPIYAMNDVFALMWLATTSAVAGRCADAKSAVQRLSELAAARPAAVGVWLGRAADVDLLCGNARAGLDAATRALARAEANGSLPGKFEALRMIATGQALLGNGAAAVAAVGQFEQLLRTRYLNAYSKFNQVRAWLVNGELERAEAIARRAIEVDYARGASVDAIHARVELARVLLARSGAGAEREIEEQLALAEAPAAAHGGPRILLPHIAELRAGLARALGDEAAHGRQLREAQRLFEEIGADGHAERLAQEIEALARASD